MENLIFGDVKNTLLENLIIKKKINKADQSRHNAFSSSDTLCFLVTAPKKAGIREISLLIWSDTTESHEIPFEYSAWDFSCDEFTLKLNLEKLCAPENNGLFFYCYKISVGNLCFYSSSINNADFTLSESADMPFCLLVYSNDYTTPSWICGGIMYHIFVDRFFEGNKKMPLRDGAIKNPDWENAVPQYPPFPGAHLENNEFFGGNLWGIIEKLGYLKELGISVIYLSPIFDAYSNHKYDTSDYTMIDEMFGGSEAFDALLTEAQKVGIKIILDGVFNHTGDKSIYFDKDRKYGELGAYHNYNSKYRKWFHFHADNSYESWWGITILPKLNLRCEECKNYFTAQGGIIEKYLKAGIGGWRLDVADELTDEFLAELRKTAKKTNPESIIIGEVWENAAIKIAYEKRREYFRGKQLDSVMNYPFKNALIEYIKHGDAEILYNELTEIYSSYPLCVSNVLMNLLGTHDTERILTVLSSDNPYDKNIDEIAYSKLTEAERIEAIKRLKLASTIQYTVYGFPCVFYGDEAGIEGYSDPFCRKPFPWHNIDKALLSHYIKLGRIRTENKAFDSGSFEITEHRDALISYKRKKDKNEITVYANAGKKEEVITLDASYKELLTDKSYKEAFVLEPMSAVILKKTN